MNGMRWTAAVTLLTAASLAAPAAAQTSATAVVGRPAAVLDAPSGDGRVLDQLQMGTLVEVVGRSGDWYLVTPPASGNRAFGWQRGWIPVSVFQPASGSRGPGRFMIRAFGRAGGTLFTAHDSFDTILGRPLNTVYGGGGQVVLPNGIFFEGAVATFRHDGTLALGTGTQVFRLGTPTRVTLTPVQLTGGYRLENTARVASYFGGGAGWYTFREESPFATGTGAIEKRSVGYHVVAGAEINVLRWMWIGGEVQWATVPKALGETGVSAIFKEKDLGGTTFAAKLIVGY